MGVGSGVGEVEGRGRRAKVMVSSASGGVWGRLTRATTNGVPPLTLSPPKTCEHHTQQE